MIWWPLLYRIAGGFLVFAACAMIGSSAAIILAGPDSEGWDSFAAAIGGLVWGGVIGIVAATVFVCLRVPSTNRNRWIVLGAILATAALAMTLLEILD